MACAEGVLPGDATEVALTPKEDTYHFQAGHSRLACAQVHEELFRSTLGAAAAEFTSRAARVRHPHPPRRAPLFLCMRCTVIWGAAQHDKSSGTRLGGLSKAIVVLEISDPVPLWDGW